MSTPKEKDAQLTNALILALKDDAVMMEINERFIAPLKSEIASLTATVSALTATIQEKDKTIESLEERVEKLETAVDVAEQYSRRNNLRVSGIQEQQDEDPYQLALDLANQKLKLTPAISISEIDRAHRVGAAESGKTRDLLIKFGTYRARHRVFEARMSLRSPSNTTFINEDLTGRRSFLLWKAREKKKKNIIKSCWSSDGKIFVRDNNGIKKLVLSVDDLPDVSSANDLPDE